MKKDYDGGSVTPNKGLKKWTIEEIEENIKTNVTDYGSMVVVAFLFKKLYGRFPKCGMSGQQAEFADGVVGMMPGHREASGEY